MCVGGGGMCVYVCVSINDVQLEHICGRGALMDLIFGIPTVCADLWSKVIKGHKAV